MTRESFHAKYGNYHTHDASAALAEAARANAVGIDGDRAVVVRFPALGYTLILQSEARSVQGMIVREPTQSPKFG
jgi:hypothetical protein